MTSSNAEPTSARPLAAALALSSLLHGLLFAPLAVLFVRPEVPVPASSLTARLTAVPMSSPDVEPVPEPVAPQIEPRKVAAASPPVSLPGPRRRIEIPKEIVFGHVTIVVDAEGPVEAPLQALIDQDPTAQRVPLEFAVPPIVDFPVEALRDIPQRRIRTLVQVRSNGDVQFVRTDEYDDVLVLAIREALDRTRAKPANEAGTIAPGWAIVVFWFELSAPLPAR